MFSGRHDQDNVISGQDNTRVSIVVVLNWLEERRAQLLGTK
jgi:hypothetical protein